jgi:hypothetical protein
MVVDRDMSVSVLCYPVAYIGRILTVFWIIDVAAKIKFIRKIIGKPKFMLLRLKLLGTIPRLS